MVPDTFCNFYIVKNHKIAKNSTTTNAGEKKHRFGGILRIKKTFMYVWLTLKSIEFSLIKLASDF